MPKKDDEKIKREFRARQSRQILAITAALFIVLLGAVLYKRPDLMGEISSQKLFSMQILTITAFVVFTVLNWRCPACKKHLGGNIYQEKCGKCGASLE